MKLYHFTSIDSFCKIWVSQKLRFSNNFSTNDIYEQRKSLPLVNKLFTTKRYSSVIEAYQAFDRLYTKELSHYKQISFTTDYFSDDERLTMYGWMSPMMWGQYAHNNSGVCIEIDSDKLILPKYSYTNKVNYVDTIPKIKAGGEYFDLNQKMIKQYVANSINNIFYIKHKHWEHENEYRLIIRSKSDNYLSVKNAINAIYVFSASGIETEIIENMIQEKVPLYTLWLVDEEDGIWIDKIYMPQYRKAMSGIVPQMPKLKL